MLNVRPPIAVNAVNRRRQKLSAQANQRISVSHSVTSFTLVTYGIRPCRPSRPCLPWVIFSQKWLKRDNRAPMPGARRTRRLAGKAFTILGTAAQAAWQAGTRHLRPARLAFAPRLTLSEYPPPVLGRMLATTKIACFLACGILG